MSEEEWKQGTCGCFGDMETLLCGCFAPCVLVKQNAENLGLGVAFTYDVYTGWGGVGNGSGIEMS